MGLELYLDLLSQPCRSIYIFARTNNIPFEFKHVELFKDSVLGKKPAAAAASGAERPRTGPSNSEGAGKISLLKKVPALKDGDFTLAECTAILLYLSRKYNTPDHWYPSDIKKRAQVDEYLSWHHANIRANAPKTMWIKVLIPLFTGQPLPSEKLQEVMEGLSASLKQFEERFLQDKAFIIGSEISLADLVAIVELMQPVGVGCDIFEDRPRLMEWRRRVEEAVGKELFFQAHEMILNIKELSNIQIDPQLKEHLAPVLMKMLKSRRAGEEARSGAGRSGRRRRAKREETPGSGALLRAGGGHAVRGAGDQPAGRAAAAGAAHEAVRSRSHHPGQTRRAGARDGAQRDAHGAVGLGRALRTAARLRHRRVGLGAAEPGAQRPLLRLPDGGAGPRPRADHDSLFPAGALADWQEQNSHDFPVTPRAAVWNKAAMKKPRDGLLHLPCFLLNQL